MFFTLRTAAFLTSPFGLLQLRSIVSRQCSQHRLKDTHTLPHTHKPSLSHTLPNTYTAATTITVCPALGLRDWTKQPICLDLTTPKTDGETLLRVCVSLYLLHGQGHHIRVCVTQRKRQVVVRCAYVGFDLRSLTSSADHSDKTNGMNTPEVKTKNFTIRQIFFFLFLFVYFYV